jgi:hypothetical protein
MPRVEGGVMRVVVTPGDENGEPQPNGEPAPAPKPPVQKFKSPPGGALYRLDPDGSTRRIWETVAEMPFALVAADPGRLFVATGDKGRIWNLDDEGRASLLLRIPSNQASAMIPAGGGLLIGGTTDARVEILGAGPRDEGSYLGPAVDAGTVADWGRVRWSASVPRGATLRLWARSGNSAEPDGTWSEWAALPRDAGSAGAAANVPPARWFQIRADLTAGRAASPLLSALEVRYLPRNRAPEIGALDVELPGVVWQRGPVQSSTRTGPLVADDPVSRDVAATLRRNARRGGALRKAFEAGARTIQWTSLDPDGDRLRFALEIRREDGGEWFPLVRDLSDEFYSWDSRAVQDGRYRVRLIADDGADNPAERRRTARRVSAIFVIDNTRPALGQPEIDAGAAGVTVRFTALDPGGAIAAVEVSLDGGAWQPLVPLDGVADSEEERYEYVIDAAEIGGEKGALRVRVTDVAGNQGGTMLLVP